MKKTDFTHILSDYTFNGVKVPISRPADLNQKPPVFGEDTTVFTVMGSIDSNGFNSGDSGRLDQIAYHYYGDPAQWRLLAWANDIYDPTNIPAGKIIQVPEQGDNTS